jgi:hypothetical protein
MTLEQRVEQIERLIKARKAISRPTTPETVLAAGEAMIARMNRMCDELRAQIRERDEMVEALNN